MIERKETHEKAIKATTRYIGTVNLKSIMNTIVKVNSRDSMLSKQRVQAPLSFGRTPIYVDFSL